MLLSLNGRRIAYDLLGSDEAPVVCITHSLASDGGMWAEQVPALLAGGFRVLRLDMRGHGGSDPVGGAVHDERAGRGRGGVCSTRSASSGCITSGCRSAGCWARPSRSSIRQRLISAMWCDTLPSTPPRAPIGLGGTHRARCAQADSLAPLADATVERWFTDAFKPAQPGALDADPRHHRGDDAGGISRLLPGDPGFRFRPRLPAVKLPVLVLCGAEDAGTPPAENRRIAALVTQAARYEEIADARHFPNVEHPDVFNQHHDGLARFQAAPVVTGGHHAAARQDRHRHRGGLRHGARGGNAVCARGRRRRGGGPRRGRRAGRGGGDR